MKVSNRISFMWWFRVAVQLGLIFLAASAESSNNILFREGNEAASTPVPPPVTLDTQNPHQAVISNGIVTITLSNPEGDVTGISHAGIEDIFDTRSPEKNRGYFDFDWGNQNGPGGSLRLQGTEFTTIAQNDNIVEVSFSTSSNGSNIAVNTDKRYILRRGDSGFYSYVIFDRPAGLPAVSFGQIRYVFKPNGNRFHYMTVSNTRQRLMPTPNDRKTGQPLAYPEAVLLTHPSNPQFKGQVDDKYFYSAENKDSLVHGWITVDSEAPVGFWMITPSNEYRSHGPTKQDLTSHCGPTTLNMFLSSHYTGESTGVEFQQGEAYTKVFGPIFSYVNTVSNKADFRSLWSDAVAQQSREAASWPYDFVEAKEFFKANKRGILGGKLLVQDGAGNPQPAVNAYIGLALPGGAGSWQTEAKSWDTVVAAISSSRGSEKLKFDEIRDVVLSETGRFWDDKNRKILRHCDVTFDESVLYKDREQKVSETTKQVGVEVELEKSTPRDVEADTQSTPDTVAEEPEVEQVTPEQVLKRSSRTIRAPDKYSPSLHYLLLTDEGEPESFDEALQVEDSIKWEQAMDDEMSSLEKNNTWVLTELPVGKRALLNKWVFRIKAEPDGKRRFKARLVVKGYSQRKGSSMREINNLKTKLSSAFEMKDLGAAKQILGMRISRDRSAGSLIDLGSIVYNPPRNGPTLWQIGIPDRSAAEFFIPNAVPPHLNNLDSTDGGEKLGPKPILLTCLNLHTFFPFTETICTVTKVEALRNTGNSYVPTTWQIVFDLSNVLKGTYTLQLGLASTTGARLEVRVNNPNARRPFFTMHVSGTDNAIARHGIHGLQSLYTVGVPSNLLVKGNNTIYLLQSNGASPFAGILYDYLRLESPATKAT
ncbi:hypothetical protein VNO77_40196 [Canavalia gladiata]|uniref:Rhamnogalacturonan endolyase n=1 Tax=Canavalia gladiata TaxID=3824 RepID=A0AAN9PR75_CANGL